MEGPILTITVVRGEGSSVHAVLDAGGISKREFGLIMCDIIRRAALGFKVSEEDMWEEVDEERNHPTSQIKELKLN